MQRGYFMLLRFEISHKNGGTLERKQKFEEVKQKAEGIEHDIWRVFQAVRSEVQGSKGGNQET
jgi:hypothetical protein